MSLATKYTDTDLKVLTRSANFGPMNVCVVVGSNFRLEGFLLLFFFLCRNPGSKEKTTLTPPSPKGRGLKFTFFMTWDICYSVKIVSIENIWDWWCRSSRKSWASWHVGRTQMSYGRRFRRRLRPYAFARILHPSGLLDAGGWSAGEIHMHTKYVKDNQIQTIFSFKSVKMLKLGRKA